MTIKDVKAIIALHGTEYTIAMQTAHDCHGKPLDKYYKHLMAQVNQKIAEYPNRFKNVKK